MSPSRSILITGGTSGVGLQCARSIAQSHPHYLVVVASRTDTNSAASSINSELKQDNVTYMPLDLSSQAKVRTFAKEWEAKNHPPIQSIVLNAGLDIPGKVRKTVDGIENTFAVNHVGHALLFHLLFPHLTTDARVVITASGTHDPAQKTGMPDAIYNSAEELAHPPPETEQYNGRQRYSTSKLCNIYWTYALHRRLVRLPNHNITVNAMDPGLMPGTGLDREEGPVFRWIWRNILPYTLPLIRLTLLTNTHTPQESGARLAELAVGTDFAGKSGLYYEGLKPIKSSIRSYDEDKQEDLWEWTVRNIAANQEEWQSFNTLGGLSKL